MLPQRIAFVDIETTGLSASYNRIIEIGIVRVEDNKIVQTYHSLINPETHLPPEIELITGITAKDLENAPTFRSIKEEILESLIDATFVAHNVRFDYGFLKNEFKKENISFSSRQFCTVKLSRYLFPTYKNHNLDAIIERFNITCKNRHRALDDAKVLFEFYQKIQQSLPIEKISEAINYCSKKTTLPPKLNTMYLEQLPESPGVYIFYDGQNMPLYVGKSINIKERVLSHFSSDIHSPTEMNISQQVERIETTTTAGELGALVLESQLIKKLLPVYNKKSRYKRELTVLRKAMNEDGYDTMQMEVLQQDNVIARKNDEAISSDKRLPRSLSVARNDTLKNILGFFKSRKQAKTFLADMAKEYELCEKLLGLEKTKDACFAYRLGRCKGACIGKEKPVVYNMRMAAAFAHSKILPWPFPNAIIIEESSPDDSHEYFIVDNWCFIGSITVDPEGNKKNSIDTDITFDLDLYKILKNYLKKPLSHQRIKTVARQELSSLM